ncbi:MAG: hypothetical protein ABSA17_07550 [Rhabdochlamydiaceae bacterium]|jgi:hypothetical protein
MTPVVSHPTQNPIHQEEPKSESSSRFSWPFNAQQTGALVLIALIVFAPPVGALGAVLASSRALPQSGLPSNATCPPLPMSPAAITAYLKFGDADHYPSDAAGQAQKLRPKDHKKNSWESDYTAQKRVNDKKFNLLTQAADDYTRAAENDHPAAQAIAYHQAKAALEEANRLPIGKTLTDQIEHFRVQEADACYGAASLAETPQEKLDWVARGLKELKINPFKFNPHENRKNLPMCDVAVSLYDTAAKAFKELPSPTYDHPLAIVSITPLEELPEDSRALLSASCLTQAAAYSRFSGNPENTQALFNEAIETLKSIDTSSSSLESRAALQDEIVSTCISARNAAGVYEVQPALSARIYSEAMIAHDLYQQAYESGGNMEEVYNLIQSVLSLEIAADYANDLRESFKLYRKAQDLVKLAHEQNPTECRNHRAFGSQVMRSVFDPPLPLDATLPGRLKQSIERVEQELRKANIGIPNRISSWFGNNV